MGRIEKALARAREQRQKGPGPAAAGTEVRSVAHAHPAPLKGPKRPTQVTRLPNVRHVDLDLALLAENRIVYAMHDSAATAAYKILRTRVLQRMRTNNWNALAITGTAPGEGKTLTAINLAISLAGEVNQIVYLVDLDLRRPSIHRYLGFEPQYGLSDYLQNNTPLSEILVNPGIDRLVILPNDKHFENSSEMLSSPRALELVQELKAHDPSRLVLFDMPPLLSSDDMIAFSPYVDALLLVVSEGKTTRDDVLRARELLHDVNVVGTVLNHSLDIASGYAYGY